MREKDGKVWGGNIGNVGKVWEDGERGEGGKDWEDDGGINGNFVGMMHGKEEG
jgi:hypothetical protein